MKDKVTFTLSEIRKHSPCQPRWEKLNKTLGPDYGDNTPITITQIIESNGLKDALWCLRAASKEFDHLWRHFAVDCAEQVKHLMRDNRSLKALEVARNHADGNATDDDLSDVSDAAWIAASDAAWDVASNAAWDGATDAWIAAWDAVMTAQSSLLKEYCRTGERVLNPEKYLSKGDK